MIVKTEAITLHYIKYKETSIIARVYTRERGMQSVIVNGVRSKRSKKNPTHFEPFSILDLVIYLSKGGDLHRLNEFETKHPVIDIRSNIRKSAIALFLAETLQKVLWTEKDKNTELFNFLSHAILAFDEVRTSFENFHLQFLLKLTALLGFRFDNVELESLPIGHSSEEIPFFISELQKADFFENVPAHGKLRSETLSAILLYIQHQLGHKLEIKSLKVLQSIFD